MVDSCMGTTMATVSLPYLASYKNVGKLFESIAAAKVPPKVTHSFLQTTLGLKNTSDRALIPLLRHLGFTDTSGTPTPTFSLLKNSHKQKAAIAAGIRHAYAPLFSADENAHKLSMDKLRSLISQVAGTDADMAARIANTFAALTKVADFDGEVGEDEQKKSKDKEDADKEDQEDDEKSNQKGRLKGLRTEFQYNIQVQLPANGSEETYLNIFNAIRKTFQ
jgi:hypothetical protein